VTARALVRQLGACRRGAAALEFALIGSVLVSLTFAGIGAGLIFWTYASMQSTAGLVARCAAVGSGVASSPCNTTDGAKSYAVTTMSTYVPIANVITTSGVSITNVTTCPPGANGATGNFKKVTIQSSFWSDSAVPLPASWPTTLSVTACYPT
jgi:Flp pilus assembly protein TadG